MPRILPLVLPRVAEQWCPPHEAEQFPGEEARFLQGDPREHIPETCALLQARAGGLLPWSGEGGDLLLAPAPRPGEEARTLVHSLQTLDDRVPVLLYACESPMLDNLRCRGEALTLLPAARWRALLRGSAWAERRPGPQGSLQNRVFLSLALDQWRSLCLFQGVEEQSRVLAEVRLDGELDLHLAAEGAELLAQGKRAQYWQGPTPTRVHLPWWAGRDARAWQLHRLADRAWPRAWREVEVQVAVGTRVRRLPAHEYLRLFRVSGSRRRLLLG